MGAGGGCAPVEIKLKEREMNPWEIVSWIGAIAVAIVILGLLILFVKAFVAPSKPEHPVDRLARTMNGGGSRER